MISLDDVLDAQTRLAGVIRDTPAIERDAISKVVGRPVVLKEEQLQRTGAYKVRGAYNHISRLPEGMEVVAASAGNHAQGVALASSLTNRQATIFMPLGTPWPKVEATRNYGAVVRLEGNNFDDALAAGKAYAEETDAHFVAPFDDDLIIAGQGTIALELLEQRPDITTVVVPIGGGGLISGIGTVIKAKRPDITVIGVEAAGAASMTAALLGDAPVLLPDAHTMADGIAVRGVAQRTFEHVKALVDDVVTVSEDEIARAVVLLLERAKAVVEPAGAVGLAALMAGKIPGDGPAGVILTGGNIDPLLLLRLVDYGLSAAGRYLVMRIILDDRPGQLSILTALLSEMRLNIIEVEHHRTGTGLDVDEVDITITIETRGTDHAQEVLESLRETGYRVEAIR